MLLKMDWHFVAKAILGKNGAQKPYSIAPSLWIVFVTYRVRVTTSPLKFDGGSIYHYINISSCHINGYWKKSIDSHRSIDFHHLSCHQDLSPALFRVSSQWAPAAARRRGKRLRHFRAFLGRKLLVFHRLKCRTWILSQLAAIVEFQIMCHGVTSLHELWTPLLGWSCCANWHWGANVLGCGDWDRLDGNFQAQTITKRNKIIQPWKVGWSSVEKILDPQTEIGGICWIFLSTENGWFSSPTLWMQKIDLDISRHCWVSHRLPPRCTNFARPQPPWQ